MTPHQKEDPMTASTTRHVPTLTLAEFAALPPGWPEYLLPPTGGGVLLARIHPDCNRPEGDEDVLARALMFDPRTDFGPATLRRITIRKQNLTWMPSPIPAPDDLTDDERQHWNLHEEHGRQFAVDRCREYADVLQAILALPVVTLR